MNMVWSTWQYRWCERISSEHLLNDKHHHKFGPWKELWSESMEASGTGSCVSNVCTLWWLLSHSLVVTPLNISCKMCIATFEKLVASVTDGVGGQKQAMNLRLMSRLISEHATSALTINLLSSSPVDIWHMHQQTHNWKWIELNPDKSAHIHTVSEAVLHIQGLMTRHSACSQLPLMYYGKT